MEIKKIDTDKKRFLDLLLLADGHEDMIDRYLERGELYVLDDGEAKAACIVTSEGGACEIKNLAVAPAHQGKGYGGSLSSWRRRMGSAAAFFTWARERCRAYFVFTSAAALSRRTGCPLFSPGTATILIHEDGVLLADMVYLKRELDGTRRGAGLPPWGL